VLLKKGVTMVGIFAKCYKNKKIVNNVKVKESWREGKKGNQSEGG